MPRAKQTARTNRVGQSNLLPRKLRPHAPATKSTPSKKVPPKVIPPNPRSPSPLPASYPQTTDPSEVREPVKKEVHRNLRTAWKVDTGHQMCYIFDSISPARQFKRGTPFDRNKEFPGFGPYPWDDLTDTDGEDPGWMPFAPVKHT